MKYDFLKFFYTTKKSEDIIKTFLGGVFKIKQTRKYTKYYICGFNVFHRKRKSSFHDDKVHIGIFIFGGVGDLVSSLRFVKGLSAYLGDEAVIDILAKDIDVPVLRTLLGSQTFVHDICLVSPKVKYDLELKKDRYAEIYSVTKNRLQEKSFAYYNLIKSFNEEHSLIFQNEFIGRGYAKLFNRNFCTEVDIDDVLDLSHVDFRIEVPVIDNLDLTALDFDKVVVVQKGGGRHFFFGPDIRQWPVENYNRLIGLIKQKHPDYTIVQVGNEEHEAISAVDLDLRGKTTFAELLYILDHAKLLIAQEGGMAITRHFLSAKRSCILFGPTDPEFFGFPENINLINRACANCCEGMPDWWRKCTKTGGPVAECMMRLTPEYVFEQIEKFL